MHPVKNAFSYIIYQIKRALHLEDKKDLFFEEKYFQNKAFYGKNILDIGSGYGSYSEILMQSGHNVTCIDIVNKSLSKQTSPVLFDGKNIPFNDNCFDTALLMFILHHANQQVYLLNEAKRVSKNYLIVAEDIIQNPVDIVLSWLHLWTSVWSKGERPFHSDMKWQKIFQECGLELISTTDIPRSKELFYPVSRRIYILKT